MKYVPAFRFCVGEAIRHKRRWLSAQSLNHCVLRRAWGYVDACFHACWMDLYGVLEKDNLVMGEDHLMNLLAAFLAASRGESVLILDEPDLGGQITRHRFDMVYPGMDTLICQTLGVERNPSITLNQQLAATLRELVNKDGEPLVHQLEYATLVHEQSGDSNSFWAEPAGKPQHVLGVDPLRFWGREKLDIFGTEIGKCPQYRGSFKRIILTSSSQYSRLTDTTTPVLALGDAANPLVNFDFYRASDRLRELLDAIKVFHHGKNVSAPDQHHP